MIFEFVLLKLPERLVFFDLLILVFKVFEKIWIWYFILKQTQIKECLIFDEKWLFFIKKWSSYIEKWLSFQ